MVTFCNLCTPLPHTILRFVEEETDVQRQNRLIAQALVSIQRLVDENSQLGQDLYEQFSKAALLTALMNMGVNVNF